MAVCLECGRIDPDYLKCRSDDLCQNHRARQQVRADIDPVLRAAWEAIERLQGKQCSLIVLENELTLSTEAQRVKQELKEEKE